VRGRVVSVAERAVEPKLQLDEHDAQWTLTQIEVAEVFDGDASKRVNVLFPKSEDILWFRVPKLKPGDAGILLLHRDAA
jgi:hypothetical protein